ncbi:VOC family protein [Nitratireductor rhodophyticola]|uniref:VOC family protein n=1 Tax=Nitratireductor rhodophyticola TaxID=2854036 RepID=A0ABS7R5W6_9HYPH|nr:VOC family protein [Nitratireductor rhodophyticola]MBY8916306.1 VOC family protein [Nitratireductor rhodophyticola]MBY8921669.1 VOC family protein [Nitratireductor rhodophyticola]MEC9244318.1 VOC family protein [Pseudomonadota bacterium]WPZ15567.1 VOC family protein [Nitratireductor rhodophyticola]
MSDTLPLNAVVWAEIPVTDLDRARDFYAAVVQNELVLREDGPNPFAIFDTRDPQDSVAGHIYPGKPAPEGTGPTIHLAVPAPLEDAMERVTKNGGKLVSPIITIPAGRFVYCLDPDGNSFGIFA